MKIYHEPERSIDGFLERRNDGEPETSGNWGSRLLRQNERVGEWATQIEGEISNHLNERRSGGRNRAEKTILDFWESSDLCWEWNLGSERGCERVRTWVERRNERNTNHKQGGTEMAVNFREIASHTESVERVVNVGARFLFGRSIIKAYIT